MIQSKDVTLPFPLLLCWPMDLTYMFVVYIFPFCSVMEYKAHPMRIFHPSYCGDLYVEYLSFSGIYMCKKASQWSWFPIFLLKLMKRRPFLSLSFLQLLIYNPDDVLCDSPCFHMEKTNTEKQLERDSWAFPFNV